MTPPADSVPSPGDLLAGKYRVERVLGTGGMGVVVAAHHLELDEKVALKFLLPHAVRNPEAVARFIREARAAVKIKSEHVARVTDVGRLEDGSPYMVMEYLEGSDLSAWLEQRGSVPFAQAADFVLQACEALADAHTLGIVHRDLKPANLFCIERSDGQLSIKVLDFGISKLTTPDAPGRGMTSTTALMGTPLYMSPEQMTHTKGVDARTDIWALGVILFELVTGRAPFVAEAVTELAIKVATEPAPLLRELCKDAPAGLEQVVAKCLEKDRARRYQTVGELAVALQEFGSPSARVSVERVLGTLRKAGVSGEAPPSGDVAVGPARTLQATPPPTGASWGHTGETAVGARSSTKVLVAVGAVFALGILALAGGMFLRKGEITASAIPSASALALPAPSVAAGKLPAPEAAASPVAVPPAPAPSPATEPSATAVAATTAPRKSGGDAPARLPATHATKPASPATPSCDPPTWTDEKGHVHIKKGC